MNIREIEDKYDVEIIKGKDWKYTACYFDEYSGDMEEVVHEDTLKELINSLEVWMSDKDFSDSDWARSIDYGGYDTEDEFWEHLYKF